MNKLAVLVVANILFGGAAALPVSGQAATETSPDLQAWAQQNVSELVTLYRYLHRHPELSFHEKQTAALLAQMWESLGAMVSTNVGGHGIVGLLKNGDGPTVMLRCDLDGLPVVEQTNLVYASKVRVKNDKGVEVGVMHACGHDFHMTTVTGTAQYLSAHRDLWQGTVLLVGQPAEERGAGAKAMLEDGLFTRFPKPDFAVAIHIDAALASNQVGYRGGYALANVDSVDITVRGRGGHGAFPHATIDPIVQAAQLILSLQTIVSREIKPVEPAVVTVGSIHGGTKHNIIGNECHLQLTVRSYSAAVRDQIHAAIRRKALAVAQGAGAPEPTVEISEGTPSLWNDEELAARLAPVFRRVVGADKVIESEMSMGGEDFSRYGKAGVPILMYRVGAVNENRLARYAQLGQQPPSLHSPLFYPDVEEALMTGIATMSAVTLELLAKPAE